MKSKKGFTLIELLAVIIIIGIILLIAFPIVKSLLYNAKKSAWDKSVRMIMESAEHNYIKNSSFQEYIYKDGVEYNADGIKLNYSGKKPLNGILLVENYSDIGFALHDGTFCARKDTYSREVITEELSKEECKSFRYTNNSTITDVANEMDIPIDVLLEINEETDPNVLLEKVKVPLDTDTGVNLDLAEAETISLDSKTYYSLGYIDYSDPFTSITNTYTINLDNINIDPEDIISVDINNKSVFTSLEDFKRYIVRKQMGDVSWPPGEEVLLDLSDAEMFKNHSVNSTNMTVDDINVTCTITCEASITYTISNVGGSTYRSTEIEGIQRDILYTPIKFTIAVNKTSSYDNTFIYEPNSIFKNTNGFVDFDIYTSVDGYANPIADCGSSDNYYTGNYQHHRCITKDSENIRLNKETNNSGDKILSGQNSYLFETQPASNSSWLGIFLISACYTTPAEYSNIKLLFEDGSSYTVNEALNADYIYPLHFYGSSASSKTYVFPTPELAMDGGTTGQKPYPNLYIYVKQRNNKIIGTSLHSSTNSAYHSSCSDGVNAFEYPNFEISLVQNQAPSNQPILTIENTHENISNDMDFVENTVRTFDYNDGDIGENINFTNNINYKVPGDYSASYSITNSGGFTNTVSKTISVVESGNLSGDIDTEYGDLTTTLSKYNDIVNDCGTADDNYIGNYRYVNCLVPSNMGRKLSFETNNYRDKILTGDITYNFNRNIIYDKSWIKLEFIGSCYTSAAEYSNLRLNFTDGTSYSIIDAVNNNYIKKEVLYATTSRYTSYIFPTPKEFLLGGSTGVKSYSNLILYFRLNEKILENVSFTSNRTSGYYSTCSDGFAAYELLNINISEFQ